MLKSSTGILILFALYELKDSVIWDPSEQSKPNNSPKPGNFVSFTQVNAARQK
jgi:hypothetical protein